MGRSTLSEQDRIELLKAVVECAPKEMGAEYSDRTYDVGDISNPACYLTGIVSFTELPDGSPLCLVSQPPYSTLDGDACFAMLDAMEKVGYVPRIQLASEASYRCDWKHKDDTINFLMLSEKGSTRAEAVSKAFVAVFGGEK